MSTEPNTSSYYRRRANEARALAFAATMQGVRKIHLEMAATYEHLAVEIESAEHRPAARETPLYAPAARTRVSSSQ